MSSRYQVVKGSDVEFTVPEYPTLAEERAFNRLLAKTADRIVPESQKEEICEKWGWDAEEVCTGEVADHLKYHLELARVIFENGNELTQGDADQLLVGKIQEARADFIQGCQGRSDGQGAFSMQALMSTVRSLIGPNAATSETTNSPNTGER